MQTKLINAAEAVQHVLADMFGFRSFRPHQEEIVRAILARQDAFIVMPTGGGKSLCYQLPARIMDGTCVVISPLISLMKDQVDAAVATGLRASFLNSSLTAPLKRTVEAALRAGELDLIYVSPERFAMPGFIAALKQIKLSFFAIDEAHCISEWGHDFRPDYLNLASLVKDFPAVPVTAFTATATHKVQDDIVLRLGLRSPHVVRASFNRANLFYKVIAKDRPGEQILRFVRAHSGEPGIVYRTTRKSVEQTADLLQKHGIKALPYHAGLIDSERARNQEAFNTDEVDVIVATIAFGMGIDKSNVRYVIHGDLPKNIEGYYQETGRSGRDGEPAICLLLFGAGDIPKLRYFIDQAEDETERNRALRGMHDMVNYATVHACRRKQLLNYFGEPWPPDGGTDRAKRNTDAAEAESLSCCDICSGEVERIDATIDAQIVMSAMVRTGERFGIGHIVSVITGENTDRIRTLEHDRIKTFGAGQNHDKRHWRFIIDNLLAQDVIAQTTGDYPVLRLLPAARDVLFNGRRLSVLKTQQKRATRKTTSDPHDYDAALFEQLRDLRKTLASAQKVPPYIIFSDRTLREMAHAMPGSEAEMLQINGVGDTRFARYGHPFMALIRAWRNR